MTPARIAIAAAVAAAAFANAIPAKAQRATEKCYGVAKAGMNDCQTHASSCAGTSKTDRQRTLGSPSRRGCARRSSAANSPRIEDRPGRVFPGLWLPGVFASPQQT